MSSKSRTLHMFFFPFLAHGHIIPAVDMAKLFASKGVKSTIITTPLNAPVISKAIGKFKAQCNNEIHIQTLNFPCAEAGLPDGCENVDTILSPDLTTVFVKATKLLQDPFEQLLHEHNPDCVVADMFFPWTTDSAAKFQIPRIVFHGTSFFSLCATESMRLYKPFKNVSSDSEPFVIPNLPGEIKLTRSQVPTFLRNEESSDLTKWMEEVKKSERRSYGVVVNSFYELEHVYADHYRKVLGRKAWHVGPVSLCNKDAEEKSCRGKETSIDDNECLKWLDKKKPNSVIYVCFGSIANFPDSQLREIAMGLEASGQQFIWVVRKNKKDKNFGEEEWLPQGFEERMEGKGLIIRGWAPQVLILEHEAIGAFVTHCGWNSNLEAVTAGVPMVTWPVSAEQFYNEKLVTDVLKIGVPVVGVTKWASHVGDSIQWEAVEKADSIQWEAVGKALKRIMAGEEAEEMRNKAKVLARMATRALEGGSSYSDLNAFIEEMTSLSH